MKFSRLSILLFFCIFQVDFTLSDYSSWRIKDNYLHTLKINIIQAGNQVDEFYKTDIYNFASHELFNLTISAIENVTNTAISTWLEIKNYANTRENKCKGTDSCTEVAKGHLLEIIDNECNSFKKYRYDAMQNLTTNEELVNLRKDKNEIDKRLYDEINHRVGTCSNYIPADNNAYNLDYEPAELCLACSLPKFRMSIIIFQENVENFKKVSLKVRKEKVQNATLGINNYRSFLANKIETIKKDALKCISNPCAEPGLL